MTSASRLAKHSGRAGPLRFKPYPEYKASGVEWLGEIPAHWEVKRLRSTVTSCQNGVWGEEPDGVHDVICVRVADFDRVRFRVDIADPTLRSIEPGVAAARGLHRGDLLLEKSGGGENQPVGALVLYDHNAPAVCSNFVARVSVSEGHDPRFLTYLHAALYACRINTRHIKQSTGIQNLDSASYLSESTGLPPAPEQRGIANFLDRETARIDALVTKKERLIELLEEQRTALITQAVTKGLEASVPLKDSGVEWLGQIPSHWGVRPLKHVTDFVNGFAFKPEEWGSVGTPIIRIENLNGGENFNCTTRQLPPKYQAERGDLLFGWSGNRGTSFGPFLWWRAGTHYVNQHIFRVVNHNADTKWLYWMLRAVTFYVEKQAHGIIGMVHITRGELGSIPIPVLSLEEQQRIAQHLDFAQSRIDALVAKVQDAIARLKELRTALISAAVTGKLDVREEAA
jgi:type I restriction enzyme, S subunit